MTDLATLPTRIDDIVRIHARRTPQACALVDNGRSWTYAELQDEVERRADWLRGLGVRAGDRVMLVGENCAVQIALLFAIARLDAWNVNVDNVVIGAASPLYGVTKAE